MKYTQDEYIVSIKRGVHYTSLTISNGKNILYENTTLPVCKSQIEAEDNAQRIADNEIKVLLKGR